MSNYNTIIFDLDGTLLDTLDDLADSVNFALQQYHYPAISADDTRRFIGDGYIKLIERALPDGYDSPHFEDCLEAFKNYYANNMTKHTKPYPGVLELLVELKKKHCLMAVVSNKGDIAVKALTNHYFGEYIQTAFGASAEIPRKPEPASVYMALEELGANKDSAVYVGDSDIDIQTAKNAGLPCVSVSWGFRDKELLERHGAKNVIDKPLELLSVLEGML